MRSAVREPFWSDAARTISASCSRMNSHSSTVAVPVEGLLKFHWRRSWTIPTPMPAAKATGRLTMAPSSAASRASRSRSGLSTSVRVLVWLGEASTAVIADSTPAIVHATVEVRRTHTPDSRADSVFSAEARMASPQGENRMKAARPSATIGATMSVMTSPGGNKKLPMWKDQSTGTGKARKSFLGRMKGKRVKRNRTWERPMVATMTMTRGRLNSRRSKSSESAPTAAASKRAAARAAQ